MKNESQYLTAYEITCGPLNEHICLKSIIEDPECLQMEVDKLLQYYNEVKIRKVIK